VTPEAEGSAPTAGDVARRLRAATPGRRAALTLEPDGTRGDHELNPDLYDPSRPMKRAAVLVPLIEARGPLSVLLTRRTTHLRDHAGQIAFPGGRIEPGDADAIACALRESEEEVGLDRAAVRPLGRLDVYVTRTGFEVTPVVGLVRGPVTPAPDPFEVAEVFEVPLGFFLDPRNRRIHSRDYQGKTRHFYVYPYGNYYIWGATAGMLNNLAEVLGPDRD
jgi:8-oxo-dGTP pyrophosphatase MutT (NUDIX family)